MTCEEVAPLPLIIAAPRSGELVPLGMEESMPPLMPIKPAVEEGAKVGAAGAG